LSNNSLVYSQSYLHKNNALYSYKPSTSHVPMQDQIINSPSYPNYIPYNDTYSYSTLSNSAAQNDDQSLSKFQYLQHQSNIVSHN
jgi:hypothetical protein